HDGEVLAERIQRLPDVGQLTLQRTFLLGHPVARRGAVWHEARKEARRSPGGGLGQRGGGGNHGIQQRQAQRYAGTTQQRAAVDVLLRNEHRVIPPSWQDRTSGSW